MAATINVNIAHSGKYWVRNQNTELGKLYAQQFGEDSSLANKASRNLWENLEAVVWSVDNLFQVLASGQVDIADPLNQTIACQLLHNSHSLCYGLHQILVEVDPNPRIQADETVELDLPSLDAGLLASKLSNAKFLAARAFSEWLKNARFVSELFKQAPNFISFFTSAQLKQYALQYPEFGAQLCASPQFSDMLLREIKTENELLELLGNPNLTPDQFNAILKFALKNSGKNNPEEYFENASINEDSHNLREFLWRILDDVVSETKRFISNERKSLCENVRKHIFGRVKNPALANMIARDSELLNLLSGRFSGPRLAQLLLMHPDKLSFFENIVHFSPKSLKTIGVPLLTLAGNNLSKSQQNRLKKLLNEYVQINEPFTRNMVKVSIRSLLQHQLQYFLTLYNSGSSEHSKCFGQFLIPILKNPLLYGQLNISSTQLNEMLNHQCHDKSLEFIISQDPLLFSKLMLHPTWAKAAENNEIPDTHLHLKARIWLERYRHDGLCAAIFEDTSQKTSPHIAYNIAVDDALWFQLNPWIYVWILYLCDVVSFRFFHVYFVSYQEDLGRQSFIFVVRQRWDGKGSFKDHLKKSICEEGLKSSQPQDLSFLSDLFSGEELSQIISSTPKEEVIEFFEGDVEGPLIIDPVFKADLRDKLPLNIENSPYVRDRYVRALISADVLDNNDPILNSDETKENLTRVEVVQMLMSDKASVRDFITSTLKAHPGLLIRLLRTNIKTNDPYEVSIREHLPQLFEVFDSLFESCGLAQHLDGKGLCQYLSLGAMPSSVDNNLIVSAAFKRSPLLVGKLISYIYSVFQESNQWDSDRIDHKVGSLLEGILLDPAVKNALLASHPEFNITHLTTFSKLWPAAFKRVVSADYGFYRNIAFSEPIKSEFIQQVFVQGADIGIKLYGENLGWTIPGMLADARTRLFILHSAEGRSQVTAPVLLECLNSGDQDTVRMVTRYPELLVKLIFDENCRDQILPVGWSAITSILEKESTLKMIASMNMSASLCYWMLQSQNSVLKDFIVELLKNNLHQGNFELLMQLISHPNFQEMTPTIEAMVESLQDSPGFISSLREGSEEQLIKIFHALPNVATRLCQHDPLIPLQLITIAAKEKGMADQFLRHHAPILVSAIFGLASSKNEPNETELKYLFSLDDATVIAALVSQPKIMKDAMRIPLALTAHHYHIILSELLTGKTSYILDNFDQPSYDYKDLLFCLQSYVNRLIIKNHPGDHPLLKFLLTTQHFLHHWIPTFDAATLHIIYHSKLDISGYLFSGIYEQFEPEAYLKFVSENIHLFTAVELNALAHKKELLTVVANSLSDQQFQSLLLSEEFKLAESFSKNFLVSNATVRMPLHQDFDGSQIVLPEAKPLDNCDVFPSKKSKITIKSPSSEQRKEKKDTWEALPDFVNLKHEDAKQRYYSIDKTFNVFANNLLKKFSIGVLPEQEKPKDFLDRVLADTHQADGWDFMRAFVIAAEQTYWYTIRPSEVANLLGQIKMAGKKTASNQLEIIKRLIKASPVFAMKVAYDPKQSTNENVVLSDDTSIQHEFNADFIKKFIISFCQNPEYYWQRVSQHPQWKKDCIDMLTYMIPMNEETFLMLCSLFRVTQSNVLIELSTSLADNSGFRHLMLRYFARHYSLNLLLNPKPDESLSEMAKIFWSAFKQKDEAIGQILNEADDASVCQLLRLCYDPSNLANYKEEVDHFISQRTMLIHRLLHCGSVEFWQPILAVPNNFLITFLAGPFFKNPSFQTNETICLLNIKHLGLTVQFLSEAEKHYPNFGLRMIELSEFMDPEVKLFTFSAMSASQRALVVQQIRQNHTIDKELLFGLMVAGDSEICASVIQNRISDGIDLLKLLESDLVKKIPVLATKAAMINHLNSEMAFVIGQYYFSLSRLILEGDQDIWHHLSLAANRFPDLAKIICLVALKQLPTQRQMVEDFLLQFFEGTRSSNFYGALNISQVSELLSWENSRITRELLAKPNIIELLLNNHYPFSREMLERVFDNFVNGDIEIGIQNLNLLLSSRLSSRYRTPLSLVFDAKIAKLELACQQLQRAEGYDSDNVNKIRQKLTSLSICYLDDNLRYQLFSRLNKNTWVSLLNVGGDQVIDQFFHDLRENSHRFNAQIHSVLTECLEKIRTPYFFKKLFSFPRLCQIAFPRLTENPEFISHFGDFKGYVSCIKPDEHSFAIRCLDSLPIPSWRPLLEFSKKPKYKSESPGLEFVRPVDGVKDFLKHSAIASRQNRSSSLDKENDDLRFDIN